MVSDKLLRVENLHVSVEGTPILNGLNLTINRGEIHAIMGRNGAGKSTLANVVMGHPAYKITEGTIHYKGSNIEEMEVFQRARDGMFLSFQYPAAIPGVQVGTFLRKSVASVRGEAPPPREFRKELKDAMEKLSMDKSFLSRYVNQGFSGGEKKRLEILQLLLLQPDLALLDETRRQRWLGDSCEIRFAVDAHAAGCRHWSRSSSRWVPTCPGGQPFCCRPMRVV